MTRDWSKETWRKQYVREPLQRRLWPVMARGLAELLNALAEEDGTLVRDVDEPVEALVRALGPHPEEVDLVAGAIGLLLREGLLARDGRAIRIPELPRAQARHEAAELDMTTEALGPPVHRRTSTERVREHRARTRTRNGEGVSGGVSSPVSQSVSSGVSGVSSGVSGVSSGVSPSRGVDHRDPSENVNREKEREKDHPPQKRGRARTSVSRLVTAGVSGVSSGVSPSVSVDEKEEDAKSVSSDLERALEVPVGERAALVLANPKLARSLLPELWPEVIVVAEALAEASGLSKPYLGRYEDDDGVQTVVKLYAAGFPERALEYVARVVPKQPWWSAGGKRLGLSSLSLEVVRRNLPNQEGRARILSPRVAKVIASVEGEAKASDGAA